VTADPHLEEIVPYSPMERRTAIEAVPTVGGFVAALALMPSHWLLMSALFAGICSMAGLFRYVSWRRKLRRKLAAAPPPPAVAVEVRRRPRRRLADAVSLLMAPPLLLAAAWLASAFEDAPFAWGLLVAATTFGTDLVAALVDVSVVRRWERRNGRVLTSLLLGAGEVFYVERSARAA